MKHVLLCWLIGTLVGAGLAVGLTALFAPHNYLLAFIIGIFCGGVCSNAGMLIGIGTERTWP